MSAGDLLASPRPGGAAECSAGAPVASLEDQWQAGRRGKTREQGFTLIEVMIALAIFAMIAAAGVAILSFSVRAGAATASRLDGAAAVARTVSILSADLAQAVDRPSRDEAGLVRPAFVGETGAATAPMLMLVRGGWSNLDGATRPTLQKVAWQVERGALERVAWPEVDGAAPLATAVMMTGVTDVRLRYRIAGAWSDRWDGRAGAALPQAAEVTIVRRDGTSWRELFIVGNGASPVAATATSRAG